MPNTFVRSGAYGEAATRNYESIEVEVAEEKSERKAAPSPDSLNAKTPFLVWLIFLAVGGGLLALYYARIGYIPDIEWSASIVYLAAASAIGGGVGLLLALSVLLPGFVWSEFLIHDPRLSKTFCYDEYEGELCVRSISYHLGIPFGLALFGSHMALLAGVAGYSIVAIVLLAVIFGVMRGRFDKLLAATQSCQTVEKARRKFKYSAWFTLSVLLSQISMLVMYRLSGGPTGSTFIILTIVCTSGVLISNHVVAVNYHRYPKQSVAASLVAAALLLFAADQFSPLSLRVMGHFGFGETKTELILTEEGIGIVEKLGLPDKCAPARRGRLCDVDLLSKLGKEYYFSLEGTTFTLPKTDVLSLSSRTND